MDPNLPISQIMTIDLITVYPDDFLVKVREVFSTYEFHHLPVVEAGERLRGIISREDFFRLSYLLTQKYVGEAAIEHQYTQIKALDLMTELPIHLDPDDSIGLAADIFLANKFHALPIVEDNVLVGIITTHDLVQYCFASPIVEEQ